MKPSSIFLTLALSLTAPLTLAQEEPQAQQPDAAASPSIPSPMQQQFERMQAMADRMVQTDDPAKRRELMQEYHQAMHETRSMMGAMPGCMGMQGYMPAGTGGKGMMGGMGMMAGGKGMAGQMMMLHAGMMEAYQQMDKRLDLMQTMLEQLMKQQN